MNGLPISFWGKLEKDDTGATVRWHPLVDHCADVAACFEGLLGQDVIRKRIARTGGLNDLTEVQRTRLCVFAALHDVGKFNVGFQNKALLNAPFRAGHVSEVLAMFGYNCREAEQLAAALDIDDMVDWAADEDTVFHLLIAAVAHHGRPGEVGHGHRPSIWKTTEQLDPFAGMSQLAAKVRSWFPAAFAPSDEPLPSTPALQHAFNGLLTLADWFGSDATVFPFSMDGDGDRFNWARKNAEHALARIGLNTGPARESVRGLAPDFHRISEHTPREAQRVVLDLSVEQQGSLTVLEAETGSGKTEAVLGRFLVMFQAGVVDGLYFALPTRTAATQIHQRVVRAVKRAFPDAGVRPPVTLAVPGYLGVDDVQGQRRLPGFEVLWNDDDIERWRYRGWAAEHPKRYLAGAIVVGTIDQVLLSALATSHAHLRATSLFRHFLVVDEVHASDSYMTRILEEVLARHLRAGGHAFLMSATLGSTARERLLRPGRRHVVPPLEEACELPYPTVMHTGSGDDVHQHMVKDDGRTQTVRVRLSQSIAEPATIAREALKAARAGARVIVLRNTVRDCLATQEALERCISTGAESVLLFGCGDTPAPHHSRFAKEDRSILDHAIEKRFGKRPSGGGCVVVATQTVQQSLDLDADLMITDLCPMDVLLQRIGRLHRHDRHRPTGFRQALVQLLVPSDRDLGVSIRRDGSASGSHGFGTVYEDLRILEATWRLLEQHTTLLIPEMNRMLVENATHPDALNAVVAELGDPWPSHETYVQGIGTAHTLHAALNLANWKAPFGTHECLFPSGALDRKIQTRLGAGDRLAHFDTSFESPFGQRCRVLTIPAYLAATEDDKMEPENIEAESGGIRFRFGSRRYRYDRLGLRHIRPTDNEDD